MSDLASWTFDPLRLPFGFTFWRWQVIDPTPGAAGPSGWSLTRSAAVAKAVRFANLVDARYVPPPGCLRCSDSGVIYTDVPVPRSRWTALEVAAVMLDGGSVVRRAPIPCPCGAAS